MRFTGAPLCLLLSMLMAWTGFVPCSADEPKTVDVWVLDQVGRHLGSEQMMVSDTVLKWKCDLAGFTAIIKAPNNDVILINERNRTYFCCKEQDWQRFMGHWSVLGLKVGTKYLLKGRRQQICGLPAQQMVYEQIAVLTQNFDDSIEFNRRLDRLRKQVFDFANDPSGSKDGTSLSLSEAKQLASEVAGGGPLKTGVRAGAELSRLTAFSPEKGPIKADGLIPKERFKRRVADVWFIQGICNNENFRRIFITLMRLPPTTQKGLPVLVREHYSRATQPLLETISITKKSVPASEFEPPAGYRPVDSEISLLMEDEEGLPKDFFADISVKGSHGLSLRVAPDEVEKLNAKKAGKENNPARDGKSSEKLVNPPGAKPSGKVQTGQRKNGSL